MDIATIMSKAEEYRLQDIELCRRGAAATSDAERLEIERMRRISQVAMLGFLSNAKGKFVRDDARRDHGAPVRSEARA